ncbi:MAG: CPBP family intramembrane metalloprotease [Hungatella sp.]|nr:CPBP family intramembrane metalloprotease [Hungatella sp.]
MLELLWQLCWPVLFYGLMIDLASILLDEYSVIVYTFVGAVLAIPVLFWRYRKIQNLKVIRQTSDCWREFTGRDGAFCILAGITSCGAVNTLIIVSPLSELFPGFSQVAKILYEPSMFWQIVTMGVAVPAAEEVAFRGLGFVKLRENCPFWQAALLSSALFGVYHGNVLQGIYGFIMGMIFAWAMERKNTIAAPFFMHMAANLTSVAVMALGKVSGVGE